MADALICSECGTPVPAGRARCGRCGGRGKDSPVVPQAAPSAWPLRFAAAAVGVLVVGIAAAALTRSSAPAPDAAQTQTTAAASQASHNAATSSATASNVSTPSSEFAASASGREGIAAYNGGDMESAVGQFTAAVEHDPNNATALNNLAQVLVRTGRAREAIPYFDRAIAAAEGEWAYHFNRARAYGELKEWRQAIAGYTDAARLFPDDYVTQFNLAKARQADGDLPGAIQAYTRAAELAPGQPDFQLSLGQALDTAGRTDEAVSAYKKFLELDPGASQAEKVKTRLSALGGAPEARPS